MAADPPPSSVPALPLTPQTVTALAVEHLQEGIQVIGFDWVYRYVNAAAARHLDRTPAELNGHTLHSCHPDFAGTPAFAALKRAMETRRPERLRQDVTAGSAVRSIELRIHPVAEGVLVLSDDVTEQRELERQLRHAQRMEALGRLAGGVAHDFNNLLMAILGYSELVGDGVRGTELAADVEEIQKAAQRAARLTRQLLDFSRPQTASVQPLDLAAVLGELEPMLRRLMPEVAIELVRSASPIVIRADQGQLEQVLVNLAINARDAMSGGGSLRIGVDVIEVSQDEGDRHGLAAGPHACITVQDTGSGMDAEVLARAFEPFFTTKAEGQGTGLGLSTVYAIVQQSGGFITVESRLSEGTSFSIYWPMVPPE